MKNILVLTDFSEAAFHAARYAAVLTQQFSFSELILYHAYQVIQPVSEISPFIGNDVELKESHVSALKEVQNKLQQIVKPGTSIRVRADDTFLVESINNVAAEENADLIVMGTTGRSKLEKVLLGSNTARIAEVSRFPVLIVPPRADIAPVKRIVFACDFEKVKDTVPADQLKMLLQEFHPELMVVHVDYKGKTFSPETPLNTFALHHFLDKFNPSYHYINNPDKVAGIMEFAEAEKASLIIMIPKSHGFFEGLFHRSKTQRLIFHTSLPLLLLHEKEKN